MKNITFTNTLSLDLMQEVEKYKSQTGITKKNVFEKALRKFFIDEKRQKMAEGFRRAKNDPEMQEIVEWGLVDYSNQIK